MLKTWMKSNRCAIAPTVLLAFCGFSLPVFAFQPLVTDDTGTQGAGGNQLEFSFNQYRAIGSDGAGRLMTLPATYTRGLTETLDVFAAFSYLQIRSNTPGGDARGSGNPSFGVKWRFYEDEARKTSFAIKPEIFFPLGAAGEGNGLGTGRTSGNLTLVLTQEVPFGSIHMNAAVRRDRFRDALLNPDITTRRASISSVWDCAEHWKLALDMGAEATNAADLRIRSKFVEIGAIYSPNDELDVALGVLRASVHPSPQLLAQTVTTGITWRFK